MVKKRVIGILFLVLLSLFAVTAETEPQTDCLYFFYGEGCPQCGEVEAYMQDLAAEHPQMQIKKYEVYFDKSNAQMLQSFYTTFKVAPREQGLPVVFTSKSYFIGSKSIINLLEGAILENQDSFCPSLTSAAVGVVSESSPKYLIETLTLPVLTSAALGDLITLGALSLLLLLLMVVIGIPDYEKLLKEREFTIKKGLVFLGGIALPFFLFGLGFLGLLGSPKVTAVFSNVFSILAILFSLGQIKYFFARKKRSREDEKLQTLKINKLNRIFFSPLSIFIGSFIAGALAVGVAGSKYLLLRNLFLDSLTRWAAFPLVIYYTIIYILPFLVLIILFYLAQNKLIYLGHKKDIYSDVSRWKIHHLKLFNFALSVIIIILSIVVLKM